MPVRLCPCGSGNHRSERYDGAGIFLTFVCDVCEEAKMARYNPRIFTSSAYCSTGDEAALEQDDYDGY